ncbi:hypothetical protein LJR220_002531 [Bradyrhizobium sp. LjRoot220]|uniref:hypothetical protein n=1 Tax=Bradyrhizobium sp. LjRoot220 TaxID=3342284 RepID=UPI003ECC4EE8
MKIASPDSALIAAITKIAPAAAVIKLKTDRKPPPDVAVGIIASGSAVTFAVTNQRAGISIIASTAAKIMTAGETTTSATRLIALLSAFAPNTTIQITAEGSGIKISSEKSTYHLPALPDPPAAFAIDHELGRIELARADCLRLLEVLPGRRDRAKPILPVRLAPSQPRRSVGRGRHRWHDLADRRCNSGSFQRR